MTNDDRVDGYFDWVTRAYEDEDVWTAQVARINALAEYCSHQGIQLDVVVFPLFNSWGDAYPFAQAHDRVARAFEAVGVRVLDLRPVYAGLTSAKLVVSRFDAHPNERAHELAADAVVERFFAPE